MAQERVDERAIRPAGHVRVGFGRGDDPAVAAGKLCDHSAPEWAVGLPSV